MRTNNLIATRVSANGCECHSCGAHVGWELFELEVDGWYIGTVAVRNGDHSFLSVHDELRSVLSSQGDDSEYDSYDFDDEV